VKLCFTNFAASVVVMLIYIVSRLLRRVIRCILNNCKKLNWPKKEKKRKERLLDNGLVSRRACRKEAILLSKKNIKNRLKFCRNGRSTSIGQQKPSLKCLGHLKNQLPGEEKVNAINPMLCQQ